jgi:hypothetical protein
MRIIKYKEKQIEQYQAFVDIGSCEKHYDSLPLYKEETVSYEDWYLDFINRPLGVQMLTLHYYLLQFNSVGIIPESLYKKILEHKDFLNEFNRTWFEEDAPFFKGLDLNREDINVDILEIIENDRGFISEVKFYNDSSICFIDEDDTIRSFYVKEKDFEMLKKEFDTILEILK